MPALHDRLMSMLITQRLPQQLGELEASARAALQSLVPHNTPSVNIERICHPDLFAAAPVPNAIAVRMSVDTSHPDLVLYPVHPGSLTEISVGVHGLDGSVGMINDKGGPNHDSLIEPVALFHSRFNPLPANWPKALYHATHRIIVHLDSKSDDEETTAILATLEALQSSSKSPLNPDNSRVLLTILDPDLSVTAAHARDTLERRGGWQSDMILIDRPSDYQALLGNATLALHASEARCADALIANVPCVAWGAASSGKLLRALLDIQFSDAPQHGATRIRYANELQHVLQQWLPATSTATETSTSTITTTDKTTTEPRPEDLSESQNVLPILTLAVDADRQPVLSARLGRSLGQGQRKFRKFRESPTRFVNDSQSPLLRPFRNKRLSS